MEVPFRSQFDSMHWAFVMTFDAQDIIGIYDGDVSCLNFRVQFKRPLPDATQAQEMYPVLINMYGKLYRMNLPQEHGAELQPLVDLPISFTSPETGYSTYLSFRVSRHYLQQLEDYRAAQQTQNMLLQAHLWGIVAVMKPRPEVEAVSRSLQQNRSGEVIRFERVHKGILFRWAVPEFLHVLTGDSTADLKTIRQQFRVLCQSRRARRSS